MNRRSLHYPSRTSSPPLVSLDLALKSQHLTPVPTSSRSLIFPLKMRSLLQDPLFLLYLRTLASPPLERESGQMDLQCPAFNPLGPHHATRVQRLVRLILRLHNMRPYNCTRTC